MNRSDILRKINGLLIQMDIILIVRFAKMNHKEEL